MRLGYISAETAVLDTVEWQRKWCIDFVHFTEQTSLDWLIDYAKKYAKSHEESELVRFLLSEANTTHFWWAYHLWVHQFDLGMCKNDNCEGYSYL